LIDKIYCPISFQAFDTIDYIKATPSFYEQNNISILQKIIIEQFKFVVLAYFKISNSQKNKAQKELFLSLVW